MSHSIKTSILTFLGNFLIVCAIFFVLGKAPVFAQAATINAVSFEWLQDRYEVIFKSSGEPKCSAKYLESPPHIDLFCDDTASHIPQPVEATGNPYVYRVNAALSKAGEKAAKITVELKWKFAYALERNSEGVVLSLFPGSVGNLAVIPGSSLQGGPTASAPTPAPSQGLDGKDSPIDLTREDLVIGPDDLLEINVFQLPEFSVTTRVLGDGSITMPLIGTIGISGLTRRQAEKKLSEALTLKSVNNPSVAVTIKEYKSRQISVLGSVRNPGIYYLTSPRTLLQILSEAGGLGGEAGNKCFIFRKGSKVEIDLYDLMQNGNQQLNIGINPGDVVNVPPQPKLYAYVLGAVRSPGAVEIVPPVGLTLAGAIARAGGPSRLANLSDIQIRRKDSQGKEQVIKVSLKDILKGKISDVQLLPDDLINVPESFF